jgi:outer membrane protein assembly factor BamB
VRQPDLPAAVAGLTPARLRRRLARGLQGQGLHRRRERRRGINAAGCGRPNCGPLWRDFATGTQAAILSSPTVANGVVYAGKNNGQVLAWKAGPCGQFICNEIWSYMMKDPIVNSSPTVVNGTVYIGGSNNLAPESVAGRLYVFALS